MKKSAFILKIKFLQISWNVWNICIKKQNKNNIFIHLFIPKFLFTYIRKIIDNLFK